MSRTLPLTKAVPLFTNTRLPKPLTSTKNNPIFLAVPVNIKEEWAASGPYLDTKYAQLAYKGLVYMEFTCLWLTTFPNCSVPVLNTRREELSRVDNMRSAEVNILFAVLI